MRRNDYSPACVLAVDDSPDVLALLRARLKPEAIELVTAGSYTEGLALALELRPDLVLLDVEMPEHSGFDLCRRLKEESSTANIPVIFLTASSDIETKVHGFDLGASDYVTKPFHPAELRARVRAALRMKRAQDLLTLRAQIDALTGLHNRAYLDELLEASIQRATHGGRPLSLVMLDLDHFKSLNDSYGHPFGDLVLQRVGDLLSRSTRPGDTACRYGGEEMTIVLTDTDIVSARAVAERIRGALEEIELAPRGKRVSITASFGIAEALATVTPGEDLRASVLIAAADAALYVAKSDGRNCVRSHGEGTSTRRSLRALAAV